MSPSVTVTEPSSATSIFAVSGSLGFAFLTASLTFSFSAAVNSSMFCTGVFSGATRLMILSVSSAFLTVLSAAMVLLPSVPIGTVTAPLSATWISSSVKPKSLFAALTASLTFCFSSSVSFAGLATVVFSGSFKVLPALSKGLTVSFASNLPVFFPSAVVTVTFPLLSTSTLSPSARLFFALTASATFSLSACVKLVGSFTSVLSGTFKSRIVSF